MHFRVLRNGCTPHPGSERAHEQMKLTTVTVGAPCWAELLTRDTEGSKAFCTAGAGVDVTASRAAALGGEVVTAPSSVGGVRRIAVLRDPRGGVFGVYRAGTDG